LRLCDRQRTDEAVRAATSGERALLGQRSGLSLDNQPSL
jgi:hypothetical protein